MQLPRNKPKFDAPMTSWAPHLVVHSLGGHSHYVAKYGDMYWAVHRTEQKFDADGFMAGQANTPVLVAETLEEIALGLDMMFPAKNGAVQAPQNQQFFMQEARNLYYIRDDVRPYLAKALEQSPGLQNAAIPTENIFEMGDGKPIVIISPCPSRACNYRCAYCYHHDHGFNKNPTAVDGWKKAILTAVERIPRPLYLSAGAMGEPLYNKEWRETALKMLSYPHVRRLAFVSNLSIDPESFLSQVDPLRIGVVASLHPSEYKDHDRNLETFVNRAAWLQERGASVVVNYVLTPRQVQAYPKYKAILRERGIPMTSNVLRGPFEGKVYPEAYTPEEHAGAEACQKDSEISFVFEQQSHDHNPYGTKCTAGRSGFFLEFDGTLYNCHFSRQPLGSVFDEKLMIRTKNSLCTAMKCESQTTIGFREDVVARYQMQGTLHHFKERPAGEIGTNSVL